MVRSENPAAYSGIMSARESSAVYTSVSNDKSPTDTMLGVYSRSFGVCSGSYDEREKPPASPPPLARAPSPQRVPSPHQRNSGTLKSSSAPAAGSPLPMKQRLKECDFDKSPTKLYLMIQEKRWDDAVKQATLSPDDASTWVCRREKDGKLRWRLLPIHAAVIFKAPERVIESLLCSFPAGAQCKDDQGMLPIHLAFRNGSSEGVVNLLLVAFPQSIDVKDRKGRIPLVLAQASSSPNRDAFIRALERGPAYYAVAAAATERASATVEQRAIFDTKIMEMQKEHAEEIERLKSTAAAEKQELEKDLANEFARFQQMNAEKTEAEKTEREGESLRLKAEREGETAMLREEKESEINRVKEEMESEKEMLRQEMQSENERLKQEMESEIERMKQEVEKEKEELKQEKESENEKLKQEIEMLKQADAVEHAGAQEKLKSLEDELIKTQETSQVLVDHVNSLEAQLKSKDETQEYLANRIASLEGEKDELKAQREMVEKELKQEKDYAIALIHQEKDGAIAEMHQEKNEAFVQNDALKEKIAQQEEELKRANHAIAHQETNLARSISTREDEKKLLGAELRKVSMELATAKANTTVIEAQLKKKIHTEQSLASQVSNLATELNDVLASSEASSATYMKRIEILERERSDLKNTVEHLTNKLSGVAGALDAMATEQERIVGAAERHEATMKAAAKLQKKIVEDAARQDRAINEAKREREEIAQLLVEQAGEIDRQVEERKRMLDVLTAQEAEMNTASRERAALIERVSSQKRTMMDLKDLELAPLIDSGKDMLEQAKNTDKSCEDGREIIITTQEGERNRTSSMMASPRSAEQTIKKAQAGEPNETYSLTPSTSSTEQIGNGGFVPGSSGSVCGSVAGSSTAGSMSTPELKTVKSYALSSTMSSTGSTGRTTDLSVVSSTPGSVSELRATPSMAASHAGIATPERTPPKPYLSSSSVDQFANLSMMTGSMVTEIRTTGSTVGSTTGSLAGNVPELKSIKSLEEEEQMRKEAEELEQQLARLKENHGIYSEVPLESESYSVAGGVPAAPTDEY